MTLEDEDYKRAQAILQSLDEAINADGWESSLFFKALRKQLEDLRDQFKKDLGLLETLTPANDQTITPAAPTDTSEVYISLYVAEGNNLKKWEALLSTLDSVHAVSRPVYKNETDVIATIKAKDYKQNDAYIAVNVRNTDILVPHNNVPPVDRNGRELLVLKDNVIHPKNILRFIHVSGQYSLVAGKLIRKADVDFLK